MKTQEELLMRILKDNKDKEYGKKYGFAKSHSIEDLILHISFRKLRQKTKKLSKPNFSLMGEKTSEVALLTGSQSASIECGFNLVGSKVYPDIDNSRYVFLIEADSFPKNFDLKKTRDVLEKS